ncbi:hypothetical protein ACFFV7_44420 [Nonomuraea spiralis]|uniref:Uncharacterized protein n=1 Tax=Nonomuraea spiralis TaxID=46182 RepID=A0ABV5IUP7_9ACTN|nr:hypothetical protein [Nonomuraea spiralis]
MEIFSAKIRVHPAARNATSWLSSSWFLVEHRAYPIRIAGADAATSAAATGAHQVGVQPGPPPPAAHAARAPG